MSLIVPRRQKGLSCSLGQFKLFFLKDMIIPYGKKQLPQGTMNFSLGKSPSSLRKHMFQFFWQSSHVHFYIGLQTIIKKPSRRATTL
jgi:hypothetical protein